MGRQHNERFLTYLFENISSSIQSKLTRKSFSICLRYTLNPLNNFNKQFERIRQMAGIESGQFHDLRRTCISTWLEQGLKEHEVMNLAGHAKFGTTHSFYFAVSRELHHCARKVSSVTLGQDFIGYLLPAPSRAAQ